jgi:3-oxoacyl-[acyl-carrier-protein] synthase-3
MEYAARITGTGSAFPKKSMTNEMLSVKLAKLGVETNDMWIQTRTGIRERRFSEINDPSEHNSSLGLEAAEKALEMAEKTPSDIDQIICATCSPDTLIPSTACWIQYKLGARRAWALDINAACSGFLYGLSMAEQYVKTGKVKVSLVLGSEVLSPFLNFNDRTSCILFGDGAGAAVVERVPHDSKSRILSSHLLSDGSLWKLFYIPAGGSNLEVTPGRYSQNLHKMRMSGKEIFKVAVRTLTDFAHTALKENGLTISDLDWFVPHQANLRIIEAVAERLGFPIEKILVNVDRYGNTSAATVPTALDEGVRDGKIKPGDIVLLDTFGAGLTYGSILLRW